jgi:periplasmic copper chaperone A
VTTNVNKSAYLLLSLLALAATPAAPGLVVRDAWVRETLAAGRSSAAYFTVENHTARAISLTGVSVSGASRAELHETSGPANALTMRRVDTIAIPAHGSLAIAPGGTHVMLFDVNPPYTSGQTVTLTLTFSDQTRQSIRATVRPLGATAVR